MARILIILIIALFFEAIGVALLSRGLKQIGEVQKISVGEVMRVIKRGATSRFVWLGVLFEAIFFCALLYLLAKADMSLIWPLTSLGFVITTLAARYFEREEVSVARWVGVCLIMAGATIVGWSQKRDAGGTQLKTAHPTEATAE